MAHGFSAVKEMYLDSFAEVFAAADQPGLQRDYLHERCTELTGTPPTATSA